mmetsp:Transcript_68808/g.128407  ORF Transcript_68808/g.128407 Transcript_68808/m.128407 type:complete len:434 (-) Transcript_68808:30-1331(-)
MSGGAEEEDVRPLAAMPQMDEPSSPDSPEPRSAHSSGRKARQPRVARTMSFLDAYTQAGHRTERPRREHGTEEKLADDLPKEPAEGMSQHDEEPHEHGVIMDLLTRTSAAISVLGALVLVIGCVVAFINITLVALKAFPMTAPAAVAVGDPSRSVTLNLVRSQLGHIIVFTLEILVAADVIETLAVPVHVQSFATLGKIAIIVAVRTCLSFFLEKELEAVDEELKHEKVHETCNHTDTLRHNPRSFPLLSSAGEGVLLDGALSWDSAPSLMLLVTMGLLVAACVLVVAKELDRRAPIAELAVVALLLGWCNREGSARLMIVAFGMAGTTAVIVNRKWLYAVFVWLTSSLLQVVVPQVGWSHHHLVFWLGGCSATAWALAEACVFLGLQQSSERLWLAILLVSITFYAVNSLPILRSPDSPVSPPSTPLRHKVE